MSIFDWVSSIVPINQFSSIAGDLQGEAFAHLGATAYVAASKFIAADNLDRPLQKLDENRKNWLRPDFASLVDTVRIVYGADMIPSINVLGFDLKTSTIAQTFGDRIYVKKGYAPDTDTVNDEMVNQLIQLAHELVHVASTTIAVRACTNSARLTFVATMTPASAMPKTAWKSTHLHSTGASRSDCSRTSPCTRYGDPRWSKG